MWLNLHRMLLTSLCKTGRHLRFTASLFLQNSSLASWSTWLHFDCKYQTKRYWKWKSNKMKEKVLYMAGLAGTTNICKEASIVTYQHPGEFPEDSRITIQPHFQHSHGIHVLGTQATVCIDGPLVCRIAPVLSAVMIPVEQVESTRLSHPSGTQDKHSTKRPKCTSVTLIGPTAIQGTLSMLVNEKGFSRGKQTTMCKGRCSPAKRPCEPYDVIMYLTTQFSHWKHTGNVCTSSTTCCYFSKKSMFLGHETSRARRLTCVWAVA